MRIVKKILVAELKISVRASNVLASLNIEDLYELALLTEHQLTYHRNCGKKTLSELKLLLAEFDLSLGSKKEYIDELRGNSINSQVELNNNIPNLKNPNLKKINYEDFFDTLPILIFPNGARLNNALKTFNCKNIKDIRKNIDAIKKQPGLGRKSMSEIRELLIDNIGFVDFKRISIIEDNYFTSPSFLIHLRSKFDNLDSAQQANIRILLSSELTRLPTFMQKYAEEFMSMSIYDLGIIKDKFETLEAGWDLLDIPEYYKSFLSEDKELSPTNSLLKLNRIIASQTSVTDEISHIANEIDLLLESGVENYKNNNFDDELASVLIENEASIMNEVMDLICKDSVRRDLFSKRLFANENEKATLDSIGKSYNLTRERIRQIGKKVLNQTKLELGHKFKKQEHQIYKLIEKKTLGFHIDELKENDFFDDFFKDDNIEPIIYFNVLVSIYEIPLKAYHNILFTEDYFRQLKDLKKEIKNFLKRSKETFVSIDSLYYEFFIDEKILKHICEVELDCELVGEEILNKHANSLSQRKKLQDAVDKMNGPFTAQEVNIALKSLHPDENLTEGRVLSYLSSLEDVLIFDWGTYIRRSDLKIDNTLKEQVTEKAIEFMKKRKAIYSLHNINEQLSRSGISHNHLTSFIIGSILTESPEIVKVGKIRLALKEDAEHLAENSIEDNLRMIFFENKEPMKPKDLKKILVEDFGYASTTVSMFLAQTNELIKLKNGLVSIPEYSGIDLSVLNSIFSELKALIIDYNYVGYKEFTNQISEKYEVSNTISESILGTSKNFFIYPKIDLISGVENPFSDKKIQEIEEIMEGLNKKNIYPDKKALRKFLKDQSE